MNQTRLKKIILSSTLCLGLCFGATDKAPAFKGITSSPQQAQQDSNDQEAMEIMGHQGNSDMVVATINGTEIPMGKVMATMLDVIKRGGYSGNSVTKELARRIRKEALEELALEELAFQKAVSLGITVDQNAVKAQIDSLIDREGGREKLEEKLAASNQSIAELTDKRYRFLMVKQAIKQEVEDKITLSDEEINIVYENNRDEFVTKERVVVTDIVFFLDPDDPQSKDMAESVRRKIINELGNNPAKLTPQGFIVEKEINVSPDTKPLLYEAAMKMKPGTLSEPLVLNGTLHLIKFDLYEPRSEKPIDEAKAYVAQKIKAAKQQQYMAEWRQKLLQDADIKIVNEAMMEQKAED